MSGPVFDPKRAVEVALGDRSVVGTSTVEEGVVRITASRTKTNKTVIRLEVDGELAGLEELNLANAPARAAVASAYPDHLEIVSRLLLLLADDQFATPAPSWKDGEGAVTVKPMMYPELLPHPDPVVLAEVLDEVRRKITDHAILSPAAAVAVTLWVAATHVLPYLDYFGILHVISVTRESGKTRLLELVKLTSAKAWAVISPTESTLFRTIEAESPTVIIDECDAMAEDRVSSFTALLNDGVSRGGCIPRTERGANGAFEVRLYSTFAPKAIGSIGQPFSDATVSRTIPIAMIRATPDELRTLKPFRYDRAERGWAALIRAKLQRAAADCGPHLRALLSTVHEDEYASAVTMPDGIYSRQADTWEPLFGLADLAGERWGGVAREAALELVQGQHSAEPVDTKIRLLGDLRTFFDAHPCRTMASGEELIAWLLADPSLGYNEYGRREQPITVSQLAKQLKHFDIRSTQTRHTELPGGKARAYYLADAQSAFARYLPPEINPPYGLRGAGTGGTAGTESSLSVPRVPRVPPLPELYGEDFGEEATAASDESPEVSPPPPPAASHPCAGCTKGFFHQPNTLCYHCKKNQREAA